MAGYWGGWVDIVISRIIEIVICFPVFFLILAIMVWLEPSITNVMIVIGLTRWTSIARYTRGEFIRIKGQDYVTAAQALGIGHCADHVPAHPAELAGPGAGDASRSASPARSWSRRG